MKIGDRVHIQHHKVPGTNTDSIFGGQYGEITAIDEECGYVLVQCGSEVMDYDIWVQTQYVQPRVTLQY